MEIIIPENIAEITLGQFLKYEELQAAELDVLTFNRRKISLFTGMPFKDTAHLRQKDYDRLTGLIDAALATDVEFVNRFTLNGIEYGFIPDLDKITIAEFADLSNYGATPETLHRTMAVLFRPIINTNGDNYEIMPYKGTEEFAEVMRDMPLNCASGALVFFWSLANELQTVTQRCLTQELQKEMKRPNTSPILAGYRQLEDWLAETFSKKIKCSK